MFSELLTNYFLICFFCYENLDKFYYVCYTYTIKLCCDKSKGEAESFAAANPVEKGVKITATKAKREGVKKKTKTPPAEKSPKPRSGARKAKSGKVVSFNAGRAKYGKK